MRKATIIFCIASSGTIILGQFDFFNSLLIFLLVGAIPGTEYSIPYQAMLLLLVGLISFIIFRILVSDTLAKAFRTRLTKVAKEHKKHLPKRRFSEI